MNNGRDWASIWRTRAQELRERAATAPKDARKALLAMAMEWDLMADDEVRARRRVAS
jgi:hypothetical protein